MPWKFNYTVIKRSETESDEPKQKKILTGKMSLDLRKVIIKCQMWSVALYAAETWTISKTDIKRTEHLKCGYGEGWKRSAGQQKLVILKY